MKTKRNLKTLRLTDAEQVKIDGYLSTHPYIHQFSTLVRVALNNFFSQNTLPDTQKQRPSFLWDYDFTPAEIMEILSGPQKKRLWLVAKILEHGSWTEIWDYLNLNLIKKDLPLLRLAPKTQSCWERALRLWNKTT